MLYKNRYRPRKTNDWRHFFLTDLVPLHFFFYLKKIIIRLLVPLSHISTCWSNSKSPWVSYCFPEHGEHQAPSVDSTFHRRCPTPLFPPYPLPLCRATSTPHVPKGGQCQISLRGMIKLLSICKCEQLLYLWFIPESFLTSVSVCIPIVSYLFSPSVELM